MSDKPKEGPNRGNAGKGRPKGSPNKTTANLKEAILLAAEQTGLDGKGKDGLTGYLRLLASTQPKSFAGLLGRVLPMQVEGPGPNGEHAVGIRVEFVSASQAA